MPMQQSQKLLAAEAAIDFVVSGLPLGLGSGSTVQAFITVLAEHVRQRGQSWVYGVVPASEKTRESLIAAGLPVLLLDQALKERSSLAVYIDGADEVDTELRMVKGGGGALTREKILSACADLFVCMADASKAVSRFGKFPVPIEVVSMAKGLVCQRLRAMGGDPVVRAGVVTDNGQRIIDVSGLDLSCPEAVETEIESWPGVICAGLFAKRPADLALIASSECVLQKKRAGAGRG